MPTRLTNPQQRALLNALPAHRKNAVKEYCHSCEMRGEGITEILKSIGDVLGPIAKELGPTVMKEFIIPFIKKKIEGKGLNPAGMGLSPAGGALKLAGQGVFPAGGALKLAGQGKKKMIKGSDEAKAHMARIRGMRKK